MVWFAAEPLCHLCFFHISLTHKLTIRPKILLIDRLHPMFAFSQKHILASLECWIERKQFEEHTKSKQNQWPLTLSCEHCSHIFSTRSRPPVETSFQSFKTSCGTRKVPSQRGCMIRRKDFIWLLSPFLRVALNDTRAWFKNKLYSLSCVPHVHVRGKLQKRLQQF